MAWCDGTALGAAISCAGIPLPSAGQALPPTPLPVPGEGRRGTTTTAVAAGNQQPSIFMRLQRIQAFKYSSGGRRQEADGAKQEGEKMQRRGEQPPVSPAEPAGPCPRAKGCFALGNATFRGQAPSRHLQSGALRGQARWMLVARGCLLLGYPVSPAPGARRRVASSCPAPAHIWLPVAGWAHLVGKDPFFSQGVRFKKLIRF